MTFHIRCRWTCCSRGVGLVQPWTPTILWFQNEWRSGCWVLSKWVQHGSCGPHKPHSGQLLVPCQWSQICHALSWGFGFFRKKGRMNRSINKLSFYFPWSSENVCVFDIYIYINRETKPSIPTIQMCVQGREINFSDKHPWSWLYHMSVCPVMIQINYLLKTAVVKLKSCFAWNLTAKQVAGT